jgi:nucleoside-diphosphate-sugar epimerase
VRVLVTGAAGLVGGAIASRAAERGDEVIQVWHASPPPPLAGGVALRCDLADATSVAQLPTDVDAVLHAAARIPSADWPDQAAAALNRSTDDAVLRHYEDAGFAGRWVFVSSVAVEHSELGTMTPYATAKAETEERTSLAFPARARSLRITSPFGPGMRHLNVLRRFADAAHRGDPITLLGTGARTQDFIAVSDVAAAALAAIDSPGGSPVVVASGEPVSMAELARLVVRISGSSSPIVHAERADPQAGFRADYDIQPAFDALGWTPVVRLEDGLRTMLESR